MQRRQEQRTILIVTSVTALLLAALLTAAAGSPGLSRETVPKQYSQAMAYYNNLTVPGTQVGKRENWLAGARNFQRIARAHPAHELAPSCLFMLGRIFRDMYRRFENPLDLGEAVAYFQDVVLLFPHHRLADDALFNTAEIYLVDKKAEDEAARTLARIIAIYPDGDMAAAAGKKLAALKNHGILRPSEPEQPLPGLAAAAVKKNEAKGAHAGPVRLQPIRYWSNNDYTRVVIETDAPVTYEYSMLPRNDDKPRRLYLDLRNCRLQPGMEASVPIRDGLLKQVRTAQHAADTVRVVLDIESIADYKIFNLQEPFRVVIDATGQKRPRPNMAGTGPRVPSLPQQLGLGIQKIVIDPGHGGKDPGAIGPNGIKEKDIVLQVAKRVAQLLKQELGCRVILTRDRDVFIPLEERTAIANTSGADLFISIHANAAPSASLRGVETYFLNLATNKEAMQVAARENATSTRQLSDLQSILRDLMQNTKVNESAKLAKFVQTDIVNGLSHSYSKICDLGVRRAPFVVLIGAQMPAILIETAFLSNPEEARRLCNHAYQQKLAGQIVAGVSQYITDLNLANLELGK
ncbi:MAG: N-acetylmuramoyl-L-alanine amidase [Deltaproteobacteria bacterium]